MNTIAIIGGGASGMMAAIFAARKGAKVLLLEQNDRLGKKILVTGNGRCNYTNTYQDASCYRSEQPDFITRVLDQFPVEKVIAFFRELGIYPKDRNGYLYPFSDQASAIRDVLEQEVYRLGIDVRTETLLHRNTENKRAIFPTDLTGFIDRRSGDSLQWIKSRTFHRF